MTPPYAIKAAVVAALALASPALAAPITVTASNSAAGLAGALVGTGVTFSNAVLTGASGASGTFTGGLQAGLGFDTGILLTSGTAAAAAVGFAGNDQPSNNVGGPATALIGNSNDAATLSFNFVTSSTAVSFSYIFASAEYPNFVASQFNDAFRFLINNVDVALIPGTATRVSINTVNNGDENNLGITNPGFFVDNRAGSNSNIPYGGRTITLSAGALNLTPGATNTLTLVIADVADRVLDSAVFIQAGSLVNEPPPPTGVPEPATLAVLGMGLLGLAAARRRLR